MKNFAKSEHKYLIQQVKQSSFKGSIGSDTLELLVHHPTSYMIVVVREMIPRIGMIGIIILVG